MNATRPPIGGKRRIPFNDLTVQWRQIAPSLREDIEQIFEKSAFCQGPFVEEFETEVAQYLSAKHAIAVNSGTSALHLATVALGIGAGDEVIAPAHTFIATLWGVIYAGATPVLCDVEKDTGNIDVAHAERRITERTKAVVPVHLYGQPGRYGGCSVAGDASWTDCVIEDAAQAIGARWQGKALGTIGVIGCYSFYPGKNLGAAGEAGLLVTDDDTLADRIRALRNHGQSERYIHQMIGFNHRMDGLQGAVLRRKLSLLDDWTTCAQGTCSCALYAERLAGLPLQVPAVCHGDHVWHLYVVRTPVARQAPGLFDSFGAAQGIDTGLHYPVPLNKQPCLAGMPGIGGSFPMAGSFLLRRGALSLPLYTGMTLDDVDYVSAAVRTFY